MTLCQSRLDQLPPGVARPRYERSGVTAGIVHIGCGNFHRAHQQWYLDRLLGEGLAGDWGILGAGVRPTDAAMRARLATQDWLTTLIELSQDGLRAQVVGSMVGFVPVEERNGALIAAMAAPEIRIVSLTVTEGGYFTTPSGGFDAAHPDIAHDAANPETPRTAFGAMVAALRRRREAGCGPFTGLSCDNLQRNGDMLKQAVFGLVRLGDPDLAAWIEAECTFPNSMVDCIVPYTGPREIALAKSLGIEDAAPVTHEPFRMWVIEDDFCAGRPELERAGAILTDNVHCHELAKIRILNGGGQLLGPVADLMGIEYVADAMNDPLLLAYFRRCQTEEILPHVPDLPETTTTDYLVSVEARFANTAMRDTTRRFAYDGASRQPGFLLPSVRDGLTSGRPVEGLALASALWCRYCAGVREDGSLIEDNDPRWSTLRRRAEAATAEPMVWLSMDQIYSDLADAPRFAEAFVYWRRKIDAHGIAPILETFIVHPAR